MFFGGPQRKVEKLLSDAAKAQGRGDRRQARKLYAQAGDQLTEQGEFERAIEAYCQAESYDIAAELAEFNGQWARASELWRHARRPAAAGRAELKLGNSQTGAALLERGGAKKEAAEVYESLGDFLRAGKLFEAVQERERAASCLVQAASQKNDPDLWIGAAKMLISTEHYADGLRILEQMGQLHRAGELLMGAGRYELAQTYFLKGGLLEHAAQAAKKQGHTTRATQLLAQAAAGQEDWPRAAALFEDAGYLEDAIDCYSRAGEPLRAAQLCERLRDFLRAASFYRIAKRPIDAERCDRKVDDPQDRSVPTTTPRSASARSPQMLEELFSAVDTLRALAQQGDRGRYAEALDLLRSVPADLPEFGRARKLLSELLEEQGDHSGAVEVLLEVLRLPQLSRSHLPALLRYGWLLERSGLPGEAIEMYKRAQQLDPEYPELAERIDFLYAKVMAGSSPDFSLDLALEG